MLKLHELPGDPGKAQKKKRVGRGEGSGLGRTSGRGNKGKQARSGAGKGPGFEGGQMRMIRRIPKFGFRNDAFRLRRAELTLDKLDKFDEGALVDMDALRARKMVSRQTEFVKVIATGKLSRKLTVKLHAFSAGARRRIEAAGGSCETVAS
jgi:large subunit ribosomal protein L15